MVKCEVGTLENFLEEKLMEMEIFKPGILDNIFYWGPVIIFAVIALGYFLVYRSSFAFADRYFYEGSDNRVFFWAVSGVCLFVALLLWTLTGGGVLRSTTNQNLVLVKKDGTSAMVLPKTQRVPYFASWNNEYYLLWGSNLSSKDGSAYGIRNEFSSNSEFHPITVNPKVRNFRYSVSFVYGEDLEKLQLYINDIARFEYNQEKWLKYHLNEFNESCGMELAKLYNPLDVAQQETFQSLFTSFMEGNHCKSDGDGEAGKVSNDNILDRMGLQVKAANFQLLELGGMVNTNHVHNRR